jgi:hypothetical protein
MKQVLFFLCICFLLAAGLNLHAQEKARFEQPVLITSAGQSADVTLAGSLCKKVNLNAKTVAQATVSDLKDVKTLVIVPGFSSKGLGAAGTSREQELERVKKLIDGAKEMKIPVLVLHIGGKPRRGIQSDDFNLMAGEAARHLIVVKQGNEDGFFTKIAGGRNIGIDVVDKIAGVMTPLAAAFK